MSHFENDQNKGFTVIETLIVLAIAGMILTIVLMAIPALIRNGHNNQRKQDVSAVLSAISRYQLNNTGSFPSSNDYLTYTKLTFYEKSDVHLNPRIASATNLADISSDTVEIYNFALCNTNGNGATGTGAGYRDIVALYKIETSNSTVTKCQQQ